MFVTPEQSEGTMSKDIKITSVEDYELTALEELFGSRVSVLEEAPLPVEPAPAEEPESATTELPGPGPVERLPGESALAWIIRRARATINRKPKNEPKEVPAVVNEPVNDNPNSIISRYRAAANVAHERSVADHERNNSATVTFRNLTNGREWGESRAYGSLRIPGLTYRQSAPYWVTTVRVGGKVLAQSSDNEPFSFTVTQQDVNREYDGVVKVADAFGNETFILFTPKQPGTYTIQYAHDGGGRRFVPFYSA